MRNWYYICRGNWYGPFTADDRVGMTPWQGHTYLWVEVRRHECGRWA